MTCQNEILKRHQYVASKRYQCGVCGKPILEGASYIVETQARGTKQITTGRRHIHCDAMLEAYMKAEDPEDKKTVHEITEALWEKCCFKLCDENQRNECSMNDIYGCELCQEKMLPPLMVIAAKNSVIDNYGWEDEEE